MAAGRAVSVVMRMASLPLLFLLPAGTWRWWEAWVLTGIYVAYAAGITVFLARRDPALLAERLRASPVQKDQKGWDRIVLSSMVLVGIAVVVVPGLDVVRFGWSAPLPLWLRVTAMVALLLVRTVLEDRTLQQELPGYREYAQVTRFRLVPGLW